MLFYKTTFHYFQFRCVIQSANVNKICPIEAQLMEIKLLKRPKHLNCDYNCRRSGQKVILRCFKVHDSLVRFKWVTTKLFFSHSFLCFGCCSQTRSVFFCIILDIILVLTVSTWRKHLSTFSLLWCFHNYLDWWGLFFPLEFYNLFCFCSL